VAGTDYQAQIDRLHLQLAAFNTRIEELEKVHPENSRVESLKASAMMLARQIDDVRCSIATEQLASLLAK
jgi:uncharacterized protein YydD (DUF2326 family)